MWILYLLGWYATGLIGTCLATYIDVRKHRYANIEFNFTMVDLYFLLLFSLAGVFAFVFGIVYIVKYIHERYDIYNRTVFKIKPKK